MNSTKRFLEDVAESIGIQEFDDPRVLQAAEEIIRSFGEKSVIGEPILVRSEFGKVFEFDAERLTETIASVTEQ